MNLDEMYALREKMDKKFIEEERNKESLRDLVIRKFKEFNEGKEPTEAEIQEDIDYVHRCQEKLKEKITIPIVGPYEEKREGEAENVS